MLKLLRNDILCLLSCSPALAIARLQTSSLENIPA